MGSRRTGGHHNPVEPLFLDDLLDLFLSILGATEEVLRDKNHPRQVRVV